MAAITGLVETSERWRAGSHSIQQHISLELAEAANGYYKAYRSFLERIAAGDLDAMFDRPINSRYVERLVRCRQLGSTLNERVDVALRFLHSQHFAAMPAQLISAQIYAELRDQVRRGAYPNKERAISRLSGFFFDVDHISVYAPYFDSIVVDRSMHELLNSRTVDLEGRWGAKVFSASNLGEFEKWLDEIEQAIPAEQREALPLAYPNLQL